jgi:hypothetical protein
MISAVPSVSSVHVELDGRLPSTAGRTDETTKGLWAPNDGSDPAVFDEIQHTNQLREGTKIDEKKKSHQSECPLSGDPSFAFVCASTI